MIIGKNISPVSAHQVRDSYSRLSTEDFMMDEAEEAHTNLVFRFHIIEELKKNLEGYDLCSTPTVDIHLLTAEKTRTFPLPTMKIDESSLEGNKNVVETVIEEVLGLEKGWFTGGKMVVVAGDLGTVKKLRSLKELRTDEHSPYHRLDWAIPAA
ncbi:hypothetical protein BGX23_002845 [Mortierella sp. AD031]|nr:hypothetical protein BGX23_002845 [Mortierella sp. AD031]